MIPVKRCWTGRLWVSLGWLHVGIGPYRLIERVTWRGRLVWWSMQGRLDHLRRIASEGLE